MVAIRILALASEEAATRTLIDALTLAFGPEALSLSRTPPPARAASVFIVLIGPDWPNAIMAPQSQQQRLALGMLLRAPGAALILPVLAHSAPIPAAEALAPDLQPLALLQVMSLREGDEGATDTQSIIQRIRTFERSRRQAQFNRGNFLLFKLVTFVPLAALVAFVLVTAILQVSSAQDLTATQYALVYPFVSVMFLTLIALWPTATVIALVTRRFRWALINGLAAPLSLALIGLASIMNGAAKFVSLVTLVIAIISLIAAWFLLPIIFGLTLPPHRRKKG